MEMHRTAFAILGAVLLSSGAAAAQQTADAVKAFDTIQTVLQSPRWVNCHIAGMRRCRATGMPHTQGVVRGKEGQGRSGPGLRRLSWHAEHARELRSGHAARRPGWHLPPESMKMVFQNSSKPSSARR
jgi:hypothetical protein